MNKREEEFKKRLLATFKSEVQVHLKTISLGLLGLESAKSREEELDLIETIYRASHTLKGASRAVNITDIETICQFLEDVFDVWKCSGLDRLPGVFDIVYNATDVINLIISSLKEGDATVEKEKISQVVTSLAGLVKASPHPVVLRRGEMGDEMEFLSRRVPPPTSPNELQRLTTGGAGTKGMV
ncbi:MAG: Hpt domain-containing protein [Nitrospira sp.]|nr:Hpt domain-containing protein [Nitrospira sp.]